MTAFALDPSAASIVAPAVLVARGVTVVDRDTAMDAPMADTERAMRTACDAGHTVAAVRSMYRRFGIDPTKTRPSSEALLRRLRKGDSLPRINSLVDIVNWCSVESQLPFGLYDLARMTGGAVLRLGREGEEYPGIRKDMIHVSGRLVVADDEGPFGNPTADSDRTMVTTATRDALIVIFAPVGCGREAASAAALTASRIQAYAGGVVERCQ